MGGLDGGAKYWRLGGGNGKRGWGMASGGWGEGGGKGGLPR